MPNWWVEQSPFSEEHVMKNPLLVAIRQMIFVGSLGLIAPSVWALGTSLGPVYPILEPNLLEMLQVHARESEKETRRRQLQAQEQMQHWATNPAGKTFPIATSVLHESLPIASPLAMIDDTYRRYWLFIDANDQAQVVLAKRFLKHCDNAAHCRVILTAGPLGKVQEELQTRLWFDQGARLSARLKIDVVPTLVTFKRASIEKVSAPAKAFPLKRFLKENSK